MRMKPCFRPQRKQRRTARVPNFGFFLLRAMTDVLGMVSMMQIYEFYANAANCEYSRLVDWHDIRILASSLLEWDAERGVGLECRGATLLDGDDGHAEGENKRCLLGIHLGERQLLAETDVERTARIDRARRVDPTKIPNARQYYCSQTLEKINHPPAAERHPKAHHLPFAYLKTGDRSPRPAHLGPLPGDGGEVAHDLRQELLLEAALLREAPDAGVHNDLLDDAARRQR